MLMQTAVFDLLLDAKDRIGTPHMKWVLKIRDKLWICDHLLYAERATLLSVLKAVAELERECRDFLLQHRLPMKPRETLWYTVKTLQLQAERMQSDLNSDTRSRFQDSRIPSALPPLMSRSTFEVYTQLAEPWETPIAGPMQEIAGILAGIPRMEEGAGIHGSAVKIRERSRVLQQHQLMESENVPVAACLRILEQQAAALQRFFEVPRASGGSGAQKEVVSVKTMKQLLGTGSLEELAGTDAVMIRNLNDFHRLKHDPLVGCLCAYLLLDGCVAVREEERGKKTRGLAGRMGLVEAMEQGLHAYLRQYEAALPLIFAWPDADATDKAIAEGTASLQGAKGGLTVEQRKEARWGVNRYLAKMKMPSYLSQKGVLGFPQSGGSLDVRPDLPERPMSVAVFDQLTGRMSSPPMEEDEALARIRVALGRFHAAETLRQEVAIARKIEEMGRRYPFRRGGGDAHLWKIAAGMCVRTLQLEVEAFLRYPISKAIRFHAWKEDVPPAFMMVSTLRKFFGIKLDWAGAGASSLEEWCGRGRDVGILPMLSSIEDYRESGAKRQKNFPPDVERQLATMLRPDEGTETRLQPETVGPSMQEQMFRHALQVFLVLAKRDESRRKYPKLSSAVEELDGLVPSVNTFFRSMHKTVSEEALPAELRHIVGLLGTFHQLRNDWDCESLRRAKAIRGA